MEFTGLQGEINILGDQLGMTLEEGLYLMQLLYQDMRTSGTPLSRCTVHDYKALLDRLNFLAAQLKDIFDKYNQSFYDQGLLEKQSAKNRLTRSEEALQNIVSLLNAADDRADREAKAAEQLKEKEAELTAKNKEADENHALAVSLSKSCDTLKHTLECNDPQELSKAFEQYNRQLLQDKTLIDDAIAALKKDAKSAADQLPGLQSQLDAAIQEKSAAVADLADAEKNVSQEKQAAEDLRDKKAAIDEEYPRLIKEIAQLKTNVAPKETLIRGLEDQLTTLTGQNAVLRKEEQQKQDAIRNMQFQNSALEIQIEEYQNPENESGIPYLETKRNELSNKIAELEARLNGDSGLKKIVEAQKIRAEELNKEIQDLEKRSPELDAKIKEAQQKLSPISKRHKDLSDTLDSITNEITHLEDKTNSQDQTTVFGLQQAVKAAEGKRDDLNGELSTENEALRTLQREIQTLTESILAAADEQKLQQLMVKREKLNDIYKSLTEDIKHLGFKDFKDDYSAGLKKIDSTLDDICQNLKKAIDYINKGEINE